MSRLRLLQGLVAFCCIVAGIALLSVPAALVAAGLLLVIDMVT